MTDDLRCVDGPMEGRWLRISAGSLTTEALLTPPEHPVLAIAAYRRAWDSKDAPDVLRLVGVVDIQRQPAAPDEPKRLLPTDGVAA